MLKHSAGKAKVLVALFSLGFLFALMAAVVSACEDQKAEATASAKDYAEEMKWDVNAISCVNQDTDGDGYVSCTISVKEGEAKVDKHVECVGDTEFGCSTKSGCRLPKVKDD